MSRFTYLVFSFLLFIGSPLAFASAFTQGTCPTGSIQTWEGSNGDVKFEGSSKLLSNKGIGYLSIKENHRNSCGLSPCAVDVTKILPQRPNFTIPSNAVLLDNIDSASGFIEGGKFKLKNGDELPLAEGVYYTYRDIELSGSSRITISGKVTLYAHKLKAGDGKGKNWSGSVGSANDDLTLFGVGKGSGEDSSKSHIKFKGSGRVYSQIFSIDHVDIEGDVEFDGTITGKKTHLKNNAIMNSKLPANCDDNPSYSDNAKYEFGVKECTSMPCTIDFDPSIDFEFAPLVFVMPTIDTDEPDDDAPSRLVITSEITADSTSVIIDQKSTLLGDYSKVHMTSISYFIMEPGVVNIDGHEVVAGFVNTNASAAKGGASSSEPVNFSSFGGTGFSSSPVVLHQIQTNANSTQWTTSGNRRESINDKLKTKLFIELSDTGNQAGISTEKIAFLAAEPSSVLSSGNSKLQFGRFTASRQSSNSAMEDGCSSSLAETDIDITGIIGKKQERRGPDGGWLRRCKIDGKNATFSIDEDQKKRSHMNEDVGYLAFEEVVNNIDICSYVPEGLQTNNYANGPIPWGSMAVSGRNNRIYSHSVDPQYSFQSLSVSQTQDLCVYPNGQTGRCSIDSYKTHTTLPINLPRNDYGDDDYSCSDTNCVARGFKYKDVVINENSILTLPEGIYWFNELKFAEQNAQLKVQGPTVIHYNKIYFEKDNVKINSTGKSEDLLLIGHGESSYVHISEDNYEIKAFFYSDQSANEQFSIDGDNNKIYGGITANSISISGANNHIYAADSCQIDPPPSNIYSIVIDPNNYHLTCDDTAQVYVIPYDDKGQEMDNVDGETVSISAQGVTFSGGSFDSQNKRYVFDIDSRDDNQYGAIPVTANVVGTAIEDTSDLIFVPLKFEINNEEYIELIAGQQKGSIPIKALACDSTGKPISLGYSVDLDESNLTQTQFIPSSGNSTPLELDASVSNGEGSVSLKFDESGMFEGDLKAPILCTDFPNAQDCPENTVKEVVGKVKFKARPWKFAICTDSNSDGNSSNGNAFVAAGEEFDVFAKPIRFTNDSSQLCSNSLVTQNYLLSSGAVVATHTQDTPSGDDAVLGTLEPTSQLTKSSSDIEFGDYGYKFNALKYSEVGSFNFTVTENPGSFYGGILEGFSGNKSIGRFYPDYLTLISNSWNYSSDHDGFAYMAQGISFNFIVEARNRDDEPVTNYGLFSDSLKASIQHVAIDEEDGAVLNTRVWLSGGNNPDTISWGEGDWSSARLTIEDFGYEFLRLASEDGPYDQTNSQFGLWVSDKVDGVDLHVLDLENNNAHYTNGTKFTAQPDFRYGRMSLKDVGGNQGSIIQVPLEVQYWSGNEFEINSDDSGSQFNGSDYCVTKIWDDSELTDAKLTSDTDDDGNDDTVSVLNGISSNLIAKQETSRREQVRLFLRQGSSPSGATCFGSEGAQPWLQYNWRGLGDEDPSTVVTFGIYRGNDRVIYRGESGLTGQ